MNRGRLRLLCSSWCVGLLVGLASAITARALTPAGTQIRNQAVASYTDDRGRTRESASNQVLTTVLPIYGLEILPDIPGSNPPGDFSGGTPALAQVAAPGNTVYYGYILQNQGNASDSFNLSYFARPAGGSVIAPASVRIYQDISGNGQVDSGDRLLLENAIGDTGSWQFGGESTFPVATGASIHLLVAIQVPSSAGTGQQIDLDLDAQSVGDGTRTDAVSNYSRTTVTDRGMVTSVKATSQTSARGGDRVTYTLSGSNPGNGPVYGGSIAGTTVMIGGIGISDGFLVRDIFEDPNNYELDSLAYLSHGPAGAEVVYYDQVSNTWNDDDSGFSPQGVGLFIATGGAGDAGAIALASGQSYSLVFSIGLADHLTASTVANHFQVLYHDNYANQESVSNTTLISIAGPGAVSPGVGLGPVDQPELGDDSGQDADTLSSADYTSLAGVDAGAGETLVFMNTVRNLGNDIDIFNITVVGNTIAGGVVSLYRSDGITPLTDTNGSGIRDPGPLAPGEDYNLVVKVRIPTGHDDANGPFNLKLRATTSNLDSAGDPVTSDTYNVIGDILSAGVDLEQDQTGEVEPGHYLDFSVTVQNIRQDGESTSAVDSYNLTLDGVLGDWTAVIYRAPEPGEELALVTITNTDDLDPDDTQSLIVRVFAPEDAGVMDGHVITLTATSTNHSSCSDSVNLTVQVAQSPGVRISPDNLGVAVRGGTYTYQHQVTNTGNATEDLTVTAEFPALGDDWSYSLLSSTGVNWGPDNTFVAVIPGDSRNLQVRVFVPASAAVGSVAVLNVTVTGDTSGETDLAVDLTTVIDGSLQLSKASTPDHVPPTLADADGAAEFHPVSYAVDFRNLGSAPVTEVKIIDAVPVNTRLVVQYDVGSELAAPSGDTLNSVVAEYSNDGGASWGYSPVVGADYADRNVTHLRWQVGTVGAGESGQVTFQVLVD